jgi:hypothetical protein
MPSTKARPGPIIHRHSELERKNGAVYCRLYCRVLARIKFKRAKKHVATKMTHCLGEIFLVKCQKQAFSFNKREAKSVLLCISACFEDMEERYMHNT